MMVLWCHGGHLSRVLPAIEVTGAGGRNGFGKHRPFRFLSEGGSKKGERKISNK